MLISCDFSPITPFNALIIYFLSGLKTGLLELIVQQIFNQSGITFQNKLLSGRTLQRQLHNVSKHHCVATCLFAGIGDDSDDQNSTTIKMTMIIMTTTVLATKNCILQQTEIFPADRNIWRHLVFEVNLQRNTFPQQGKHGLHEKTHPPLLHIQRIKV